MQDQSLQSRFSLLWSALGCRGESSKTFHELEDRYAEPHRVYHTMEHVIRCLSELDAAADTALRPDLTEAALWFHDAVYDPHASDNEQRSAELAVRLLGESGLNDADLGSVALLILSTRIDAAMDGRDSLLIADCDLSILGAPRGLFDRYEEGIRREYSFLSETEFRAGRGAVLRGFLDRPAIFRTERFARQYEQAARDNITASLQRSVR